MACHGHALQADNFTDNSPWSRKHTGYGWTRPETHPGTVEQLPRSTTIASLSLTDLSERYSSQGISLYLAHGHVEMNGESACADAKTHLGRARKREFEAREPRICSHTPFVCNLPDVRPVLGLLHQGLLPAAALSTFCKLSFCLFTVTGSYPISFLRNVPDILLDSSIVIDFVIHILCHRLWPTPAALQQPCPES